MPLLNSKRKLSNVRLTRQFQIRYYGWWYVLTFMLISLLCITFFLLYDQQWQEVMRSDPTRAADYLLFRSNFMVKLVGIALVVMICVTALGIMTAHRVAGPLLAMRKAFEEIGAGNFDFQLRFRKEDDLSDIEDSFNKMMTKVRENLKS